MAFADWRLSIEGDRFSGAWRCQLTAGRGRVAYARDVVTIRLSGKVDMSEAFVRIDGGTPARWRDFLPKVAAIDPGFASDLDARTLSIPAALLRDAQSVAISPAFGKRVHTFRIAGLGSAVESAAARGCGPAAFLLRR